MIGHNVDPQVWFKVMEHVANIHNHKAHTDKKYYLSPITEEMGEIGQISLLIEFHLNAELLYQ